MKSKVFYFVLLIVVLLIILYQIPAKKADFFKLYKMNDRPAQLLKRFYQKPVKTININGVDWQYYAGGKGDKTILFCHGMGGAYDLWWQQVAAFEKDYKVITFTLPEAVDNLAAVKTGIEAILKEEHIDKFYVVGTSMGGYIAQYLVKTMPERVEKAVFGNTFPPNTEIAAENAGKAKILPWLPEIFVAKFGEKQLKNKLLPAAHNDSLLAAFLPSLPFSKKGFLGRYMVVIDMFTINPCRYEYKRIPKLIFESDNDPLISKSLRQQLKELYPDAEVYTFHNEGHFPYINVAAEYNKVLKRFLERPNPYKAVEHSINEYFRGRKQADTSLLQKVFYPGARLFTRQNDTITGITLAQYLEKVRQDGAQDIKTEIRDVTVRGNMATARTVFVYPAVTYLDVLTLLSDGKQWYIVNKSFEKIR